MLVNLHPIDLVSRPSKNPRPVVFPHPFRLSINPALRKLPIRAGCRIPAQCRYSFWPVMANCRKTSPIRIFALPLRLRRSRLEFRAHHVDHEASFRTAEGGQTVFDVPPDDARGG